MWFTSDNASGAAPEIMAALTRANEGNARSYGAEAQMDQVRDLVRRIFEAPEAAVHLVTTGTAANALSLSLLTPPWGAVYCHSHAHIAEDECGAPEFYSGGAKLVPVGGAHGRMAAEGLEAAILRAKGAGVHGVQPGAVSITNVTEAGTVHSASEIAALAGVARAHGVPVQLDGARFANALVATGATAAEMTWRAGVDVVSFGGTKNGCLGVEAVVIFDPAKAWEFELRRKRAGHLMSKHRYLSAQMAAYLQEGLWLRLAGHANAMAARLARGLAEMPEVDLLHPVEANMLFPEWPEGRHASLEAAGASYYPMPSPMGRERARLVTSWSTTEAEVDQFLAALRG
ncbi:threonine aldolase family protein [Tabrizicola oligotrophica]|uniref:L-threonine aldolase n=1 Tax=Tabrizicola oligotrophica TaxID=2710650 RepID=A0A6M0QTE5_9RHOB|nr:low specificity L-threonine aldolase [Tabrizicola oligotrophica]NEY90720.1 low specificity L-threonine aldolase [Tabrizicola oligotrophica]